MAREIGVVSTKHRLPLTAGQEPGRSARRAHHIRSARRTSLDEDVRRPARIGRPRRKLSTAHAAPSYFQPLFPLLFV